ncbi:hypothetical protein HYX58_05845 [Candidatus Dependentiae bacterium]|nr:hypothetical protein [Candidatus Dependentiae bacterium]
MVKINQIHLIAFLGLAVHIIPAYSMEDKETPKKGFGAVIKQLEKKGQRRLSESSGIHGHFNPVHGQQHTTKLGFMKAIKDGNVQEVKRIAEKHSSYVESPQIGQYAIDVYANQSKNQAHKEIVGAIVINCEKNEVLQRLKPQTQSVNDMLQIGMLGNEGNLVAVTQYWAKKEKKKKKEKRLSLFSKKDISSSDSSSESGE